MIKWKSYGRKWWWLNLRYAPEIWVRGMNLKYAKLTCKHPDVLTLIQQATVNRFLNILLLIRQFFCWVSYYSVPVRGKILMITHTKH
jgi:hypothetical protein